jgi:hypothetical protein
MDVGAVRAPVALVMPFPAIPAPPRLPTRTGTASEATTLRFDRKDLREAGHRAHAAGRLSDEQLVRVEELCDVLGEGRFGSTVELADEDLLEVFDAESAGEWIEVPFPVSGLVDSRRTGGASAEWLSDDALLETSGESSVASFPESLPVWSDDAWSDAPATPSIVSFPHVSAPASWASNGVDSITGNHPARFDGAPSSALASHDVYPVPSSVKASNAITLPPPVREGSRSPEGPGAFPSSVPLAQVTLLSARHSVSKLVPFAPLHAGTKLRTPLSDASLAGGPSSLRRAEPEPSKGSPLAPLLFAAVLVLGLIGEVMLAQGGSTPPAQVKTSKPATATIAAANGPSTPSIAIVSAPGR